MESRGTDGSDLTAGETLFLRLTESGFAHAWEFWVQFIGSPLEVVVLDDGEEGDIEKEEEEEFQQMI